MMPPPVSDEWLCAKDHCDAHMITHTPSACAPGNMMHWCSGEPGKPLRNMRRVERAEGDPPPQPRRTKPQRKRR